LGFAKQTEKQSKQIEFRFVSVRTEQKFDCFEDNLDQTEDRKSCMSEGGG
jgi:hypothetical protein